MEWASLEKFAESEWSLVILGIMTFFESVFSPLPPDPLLIAMALLSPNQAILFGVICTIFSVLGAVFGYGLGKWFGKPLLSKMISESLIDKSEGFFNRYGVWAILIAAFTPIPYKVFAILSGILQLNMKKFLIASLIGRGGRFITLGVLIAIFGDDIRGFLENEFQTLTILGGAFLVLTLVGIWAYVWLKSRNTQID
ncbi:MAG: DedA family protein [SAR202 cluster bacterium]|nr:MAG: DedA family protein [SAR202 cluster bacterium]|tara:strand:+ start:896 stop:1486 length:591 start_codon:yes stop_codon:yes gene_type:complete